MTMKPRTTPNVSCSTLTMGTRQLVVQEALEITVMSRVMTDWLTPNTTVASTPSAGALMSTLRAPAAISLAASSFLVNSPVHSIATSTPW